MPTYPGRPSQPDCQTTGLGVEPATMLKINSMVQTSRTNWIPEPRRIGKPPLTEATIEATAYNNSPIKFCGKCTVWVQFNGRKAEMDSHVLERTTRSLLYSNSGLGRCTTTQATLKFKMEPVPKFFRARPVPLALRPKVEEKLQEL
ncbi:hypothetical protein COOONC_25616, partial [Cooperia oncophora]